MPEPQSHEFHVEMLVPALPDATTVDIAFPAWAPGSYMIRDFVRHVYGLRITRGEGRAAGGKRAAAVSAERVDKQTWRVTPGGAAFTVKYRVFAFESTVRTSFLDDSHAYFNGTSLFFAVVGQGGHPCRLEVRAPRGWHIDTALPRLSARAGAAGDAVFLAADYDELVDSPVEIGTHERFAFRDRGARFELALYGRSNADRRRLVGILRRVVRATADIFGGLPFDRYLFIVHALPVGSGGLEHHASVTMDIAGLSFEDEKAYQRFADLAAHEFFHAWNVKRLHDPVLGPFDYGRENYTRLLWFHEGFTDYLANVIILRAGIIGERDFWRWIGDDWPKYASRPGRNQTPLDELSFEAWIKQYKPAENYFNSAVSYYEKGLWAGLALDLHLRLASRRRRGLPELFAWLWRHAGRRSAAVRESDIRAAARAVAGRTMDPFFERYIHGTDELPVPALLRRVGLDIKRIAPWEEANGDGEGDAVKRARARAWSGALVQGQVVGGHERAMVRNVLPGSPAAAAGLTFGDEIVAVDGDRVSAGTVAKRLGDHRPGTAVTVHYFRRDRLRQARLSLGTSPERRYVVAPDEGAPAAARAVRRAWLGI